MQRKDFIRQVQEVSTAAVVGLGMKRRGLGVLTLRMTEDISGQIGLNVETARDPVSVFISPFVGMRSDRVQQVVSRAKGVPYHSFNPPTAGRALGYLMAEGRFHSYEFEDDAVLAERSSEIADAVKRYALPLFARYATLDGLATLVSSWGTWQEVAERLPAIHCVKGASEGELRELSSRLLQEGLDAGIAAARTYSDYLKRFFDLLESNRRIGSA